MARQLELVFKIRSEGQQMLQGIASILNGMNGEIKVGAQQFASFEVSLGRTSKGMKDLADGSKTVGDSLGATIFKATALSSAFMSMAGSIKNYTREAAEYAARTQQLTVVVDALARANSMSIDQTRQKIAQVQIQGITKQDSLKSVARLIQAGVDVSYAPQLARLAQDAAKIGGVSSSEALDQIAYSIATQQVRPLHTLGLQVLYKDAYAKYAKEHNIKQKTLTEDQRTSARTEQVLGASDSIFGVYEASLATTGGQMQSLSRYADDLKGALGMGLQPVVFRLATTMRDLGRMAEENSDKFNKVSAAALGAGVAVTTFTFLNGVPLPWRAGISAGAGVVAGAMATEDSVTSITKRYTDQQSEFDRKMRNNDRAFSLGLIDQKTYERNKKQSPRLQEYLKDQALDEYAQEYLQQKKRGVNIGDLGAPIDPNGFIPVGDVLMPTGSGRLPAIEDYTGPYGFSRKQILDRVWNMEHPAPGNLKPRPPLTEDTGEAEQMEKQARSLLRTYMKQRRSAEMALMSPEQRIGAEYAEGVQDLNFQMEGLSPAARAQASGAYGMLRQKADLDKQKYVRDLQVSRLQEDADHEIRLIELDKTSDHDLAAYAKFRDRRISQATAAFEAQGAGGDKVARDKAIRAANWEYDYAERRKVKADQEDQRSYADDSISIASNYSLAMLRVHGKDQTPEQEKALINETAYIKEGAAFDKWLNSKDSFKDESVLRMEVAAAYQEKMVATAELGVRKAEEEKAVRLQGAQQEAEFQTKLFQLRNPNDQLAVIGFSLQKQLQIAGEKYAVDHKDGEYQLAVTKANEDATLHVLELQKAHVDQYRETSRTMYRALISSGAGGGISSMLKSQALTVGEGFFTNISTEAFKRVGPAMAEWGKGLNMPKWLTQGTVLDPSNALQLNSTATEQNTTSITTNTTTMAQLDASMKALALGGTGAFGSAAGTLGTVGSTLSQNGFSLGSASLSSYSNDELKKIASDGMNLGGSTWETSSPRSLGSKVSSSVAAGAAAAAAGYGIYSGIHQGGVRGGVTAGASAAGLVATLPTLLPAIGKALPMLGPIGAIASIGLGLVGAFMPNKRAQYDKDVNTALKNNKWTMPDSRDYSLDTSGFEVDYNYRGKARTGSQIINVTNNIDAMDAESIAARSDDLTEIVRQAVQSNGSLRAEIADAAKYA
jgi:hypothetical protein